MDNVEIQLSSRWVGMNKFRPHPAGEAYTKSPHRFNTVAAGRRSGKTERLKRKMVQRAHDAITEWTPRFALGAPTRDQAKRIFWDDLKELVGRDSMIQPPMETDLMVKLINGAEIWVVGLDKPQRIEGSPWDGIGLTEVANLKPTAWGQNIRPALSDRNGWCDLEGVPEGRNHFYDLDRDARAQMKALGDESEWGAYGWPSADVLPAKEIEAAKRDLDPLTFDQEYNASFVNFEGRAYYPYTEATHTANLKYDDLKPLVLCFDFNVEPGVCAIIQEQLLPLQFLHAPSGVPILNKPIIGTGVIAEVHIPRNSSTPSVCKKIIQMFGEHRGRVKCYGDPTGGNRGSAKVSGSDWDLIEAELRPVFRERLEFYVKPSAGPERPRVNAVNSRLMSISKDVRLMVDARRAPKTARDFEGVSLLKGGSGELDKKKDLTLTHLTDGIGYYCEWEYPVSGDRMERVVLSGA